LERQFWNVFRRLNSLNERLWDDRNWRIVLQSSFWITEDKCSGLWGAAIEQSCGGPQQLVMNSPATSVARSTGDRRLFALFAEKSLQAIFGLQHYRRKAAVHRRTE
jgi:hypothetical protein